MGEGEPGEEARGAGGRGGGGGGGGWGGAEHTARGEGGRGARGHTRGWSGRERERARGQREGGGTRGTLAGGGTGEPPSSWSRPKRETPETAADWLTMAQVVGARETGRLLFPPSKIPPPASLHQRPLFRAHAHKLAVVAERESRGARAGGTDGAGLNSKRAPA